MVVTSNPSRRFASMDGLRGVAIILVVLSHGWVLWPMNAIDGNAWLTPWFRGGNAAVTVFLVASGFLSYRVLTSGGGLTSMRPGVAILRRVFRVGPTLWAMLALVLLVAAVDVHDFASKQQNADSAWMVVTYRYNWLVQENILASRDDLGHLWYLSVDMQAFVITAVIAWCLRRHQLRFLMSMAALFLILMAWRFHVADLEPPFSVMNRTTARMDAFVIGVLAAGVMAHLPAKHAAYPWVARVSLLLMVPTLYWCRQDQSYLHWGGTTLEVLVAVFIVATSLTGTQLLSNRYLVNLGQMSLILYVWHFPVLRFVQRQDLSWHWTLQVLAAAVITAALCWLSQTVIERRVKMALSHPRWHALRQDGIGQTLLHELRGRRRIATRSGAATSDYAR